MAEPAPQRPATPEPARPPRQARKIDRADIEELFLQLKLLEARVKALEGTR